MRPDYDASSYLWNTWSDSELRAWVVKEKAADNAKAADMKRHELENLVSANYNKASDTISSAWNENSMKGWLVKNGLLKSDAEATKDQVNWLV